LREQQNHILQPCRLAGVYTKYAGYFLAFIMAVVDEDDTEDEAKQE
jgi:hypothetical protein